MFEHLPTKVVKYAQSPVFTPHTIPGALVGGYQNVTPDCNVTLQVDFFRIPKQEVAQ